MVSTKKSHILKQTCSFQLQVYLSTCDLLVDIRHWRLKQNLNRHFPNTKNKICLWFILQLFFHKFGRWLSLFILIHQTKSSRGNRGKTHCDRSYPAYIYLLKVNKKNTRKRCEICSKLTIKTPERRQWLVLVFLLTLNIFHIFF